jgi:hypothetical protein
MEGEKAFYVQCTGQIESGDFGSIDDIYCRYAFHIGHDWAISAVSSREFQISFAFFIIFSREDVT